MSYSRPLYNNYDNTIWNNHQDSMSFENDNHNDIAIAWKHDIVTKHKKAKVQKFQKNTEVTDFLYIYSIYTYIALFCNVVETTSTSIVVMSSYEDAYWLVVSCHNILYTWQIRRFPVYCIHRMGFTHSCQSSYHELQCFLEEQIQRWALRGNS
jgi:succinate-acetate transporter protein